MPTIINFSIVFTVKVFRITCYSEVDGTTSLCSKERSPCFCWAKSRAQMCQWALMNLGQFKNMPLSVWELFLGLLLCSSLIFCSASFLFVTLFLLLPTHTACLSVQVVSKLVQIREYIGKAISMRDDLVEKNDVPANVERLSLLITHLKEQEKSYLRFLQKMLVRILGIVCVQCSFF